jgi:hypothetical protein
VILEESAKNFVIEFSVLIKGKVFEETNQRLGNRELKSPFFISEAAFDEWNDMFH